MTHLQQFSLAYLQGFRTAAGQQILDAQQRAMNGMSTEADLESLRRAAMIIYDQYLSDKVLIVNFYEDTHIQDSLYNMIT